MSNNNIVVKDFSYIGGFSDLPTDVKKAVVLEEINTSRYTLLGAVNQFSKMKLKCRYHNRRDRLGKWTCKRNRK